MNKTSCKYCRETFLWEEKNALIKYPMGKYKIPCPYCKKLLTVFVDN